MIAAPRARSIELLRWALGLGWFLAIVLLFFFNGRDVFLLTLFLAVGLAVVAGALFGVVRYRALGRKALTRWACLFGAGLAFGGVVYTIVAWDPTGLFGRTPDERNAGNRPYIAFGVIVFACAVLVVTREWKHVRAIVAGALLPTGAFVVAGMVGMIVEMSGRHYVQVYACQTQFDSKTWIADLSGAEGPTSRQCMVRDLLRQRLLLGLERPEIVRLLGPPVESPHPGVMEYMVGPLGLDHQWLDIEFDANGKAVSASVHSD